MSKYDDYDDYDDDEYEDDEDFEDDDYDDDDDDAKSSQSSSSSNPFSRPGASGLPGSRVSGAGLPRPASPSGGSSGSGSGGITTPSPIRSPGANPGGSSSGGSSGGFGQRPPQGGSSSSGSSGSSSGGSSSGSGGNPFSRPSPFGGSGSSGSSGSGSSGSSSSGSGSGGSNSNPFGSRPSPFSPGGSGSSSSGGSSSGGSSSSGSSSGGFGQRPAVGGSGSNPSDRDRDRDRRDDPKSSGGLSGRSSFGGGDKKDDSRRDDGRKEDNRREDKKDDKPSGGLGGALGGLASRSPFGGGDKKDDGRKDDKSQAKKDDKPSGGLGGALGGLASRSPFGGGDKKDDGRKDDKSQAKKDDKPSGGLGGALGGLASRSPFGGGDKKDDGRKDDKSASGGASSARPGGSPPSGGSSSSSSSGGGFMSKLGSQGGSSSSAPGSSSKPGDKKDDAKPGAVAALGGLASRLPFGASNKADDAAKKANKDDKNKPAATAVGGTGSKLPFGNRGGGKPEPAKPVGKGGKTAAASATGNTFTDRLKNFFNPPEDTKSARARVSKAPKVQDGGISLDTKLDILGVTLVIVSLGILLSSLSPSQGAITGGITGTLSTIFGQGAIVIPLVMFAAGVYLILRHFGDEAPTISGTRLIGLGMLFVGGLAFLQYLDALSYPPGTGTSFEEYVNTQLPFLLDLAAQFGRGGGQIGGAIYLFLIKNFGEVLGFFLIIGWLIVAIMLSLKLSAAEIAIIIMSIGRSFVDAVSHRRQAAAVRRAERAEQAAAKAAAQAQAQAAAAISIARPVEILPGGQQNALPAPIAAPAAFAPAEERTIQLTMRGQTTTARFGEGESGQSPTMQPSPMPAAPMPTPSASVGGQPSAPAAPAVSAPAKEERGGLFGGLRRAVPGTVIGAAVSGDSKDNKTDQKSGGLFGGLRRGGKDENAAQPSPAGTPPPAAASPAMTAATIPLAQPAVTQPAPAIPAQPAASAMPASPAPSAPERSPYAPPVSPTPAATAPVPQPAPVGSQPTNPAASPAPAEPPPVRLGDLMRGTSTTQPAASPAGTAPAGTAPAQQPAASTAPAVQPFQRPPLGAVVSPTASTPAAQAPAKPAEETPGILGLTTPVVTSRSTVGGARTEGDSPIPPPPPARTAGILAGSPSAQPAIPGGSVSSILDDVAGPPPPPPVKRAPKEWKLPDLSTLVSGQDQELDHGVLIQRAKVIEETLESFGAPGRVVEVRTGPVITQFGVEPDYITARGKKNRVKVSAIAALDKDLQLALGAKSIRIEAPVPGKGYVGIEVPNEQSAIVRLRDVMESPEFRKITGPLAIALGQGVDGTPVAADLATMPHLLIAGTTGSGKSVCVNSIISSLILRNTPQRMKFIMVDPKRVELTQYNGIPHLVAPVVVELERIVSVLKWVTREMDERYRRFSAAGARNIDDFNRHLREGDEWMPYIVVIIDELADLMMQAPDETEKTITRIAALARATGIHLVIATQRPSVDVVTGLIKANFPARIAFAVAGGVDSRVILDQPGAERLLGRGDMLYMSGDSPAPVRLQGVFVSDTEINSITRFWRTQMTEEDLIAASRPLPSAFVDDGRERDSSGSAWNPAVQGRGVPSPQNRLGGAQQQAFWDRESTGQSAVVQSMRRDEDDDDFDDEDFEDGEDSMFNEAVELVRREKRASVSLLQRRLRIGYTRAARLIDIMEERGIVGPAKDGSSIPRDVVG